ncbi:MAG: 3-oxoacyl-[acyl-carrier-protein] synthase III C-terminal domain-containing protein [Pseudomonadota bacterium]
MRISAVRHRVPSRVVTNDEVLDLLDRSNPTLSRTKKRCYLAAVRHLFRACDANTRHWRDTDQGERAHELITGAMQDALNDAGMVPNDIDLLIYCGVGKGFVEPANAYFFAKAMGMKETNCFDITDACMSWIRALQTAYLMLKAGSFRRIMIINGECHYGIHDSWRIRELRALEHTFPMYTIGEAATATIVEASDVEWQFDYMSEPEHADLCTIPMPAFREFSEPSERIGLNGPQTFVSFGRELFNHGARLTTTLMQRVIHDFQAISWYFPHAPSKTIYKESFQKIQAPTNKLYLDVFPKFGNVVSASIPVGLSKAKADGSLARGDSIALIPASAGMVASCVQFTF